ncbi:hypothetical protein GCM10018966_009530 [Streptomyces yanii]
MDGPSVCSCPCSVSATTDGAGHREVAVCERTDTEFTPWSDIGSLKVHRSREAPPAPPGLIDGRSGTRGRKNNQ